MPLLIECSDLVRRVEEGGWPFPLLPAANDCRAISGKINQSLAAISGPARSSDPTDNYGLGFGFEDAGGCGAVAGAGVFPGVCAGAGFEAGLLVL